ncbi:MAG: bifunctional molybdenum cofactor biosynthesis protein MoaC/MoaB [Nevskiales bacterium]|nr:bifunctional molybdenum cofactor biosynthesis protein MoaC/MoaB [Nevskiales bacterium]
MQDLTLKSSTLRTARAAGTLILPPAAVALVRDRQVDKGDVREAARIAGLMAVKKTPELLPHCHPLPILNTDIDVQCTPTGLAITATVCTLAATGVEMEALTAVSIAALCAYDMLKPHVPQEQMRISELRLLEKTGGQSQFHRRLARPVSAAVIVLSDTVASGRKPDTAGRAVQTALQSAGFDPVAYEVLPDEPERLAPCLKTHLERSVSVIATVGGTGLGPRDRTVETVRPLLTLEVPGLMEAARSFGQARTPYAMLSRGIAGFSGNTLIVTFPGSRRGAEETVAALLPGLIHLLDVFHGARHRGGYGEGNS